MSGVLLSWAVPSSGWAPDPTEFVLQRSKDSGATWFDIVGVRDGLATIQGTTFEWQFDRAVDGYPEPGINYGSIPLSSYRFRVRSRSFAGVLSSGWAESTVNVAGYKTWLPEIAPSLSAHSAARTVMLKWASEIASYGFLRFEVQISKDGQAWYEPASSLDPRSSEDAWRQTATVGADLDVFIPSWTQALPLSGQASGSPQNTSYQYRVRVVLDCPYSGQEGASIQNSGGRRASAWSASCAAMALATGAADIVLAHTPTGGMSDNALTAKNLYVESFAALTGNLCAIQGGVDDPYNYWTLDDFSGRPADRPVGSLRVGSRHPDDDPQGRAVFLRVRPDAMNTLADPVLWLNAGTDYIKFHAGGIALKATVLKLDAFATELYSQLNIHTSLASPGNALTLRKGSNNLGYIGVAGTEVLNLQSNGLRINGYAEAFSLQLRGSVNSGGYWRGFLAAWESATEKAFISGHNPGIAWEDLLICPYGGNVAIGVNDLSGCKLLVKASVQQFAIAVFQSADGIRRFSIEDKSEFIRLATNEGGLRVWSDGGGDVFMINKNEIFWTRVRTIFASISSYGTGFRIYENDEIIVSQSSPVGDQFSPLEAFRNRYSMPSNKVIMVHGEVNSGAVILTRIKYISASSHYYLSGFNQENTTKNLKQWSTTITSGNNGGVSSFSFAI